MYKHDLALNNLQGLIYYKMKPTNLFLSSLQVFRLSFYSTDWKYKITLNKVSAQLAGAVEYTDSISAEG